MNWIILVMAIGFAVATWLMAFGVIVAFLMCTVSYDDNSRFWRFVDWASKNEWCFVCYYPIAIGLAILTFPFDEDELENLSCKGG